MKKLIAIVLVVLALSALTVCAFAAGSQEPAQEEEAGYPLRGRPGLLHHFTFPSVSLPSGRSAWH